MNTWEQMHGWNGLYALEIIAWMGQMRYVGDLAWDGWYGMNKWIERMEGQTEWIDQIDVLDGQIRGME